MFYPYVKYTKDNIFTIFTNMAYAPIDNCENAQADFQVDVANTTSYMRFHRPITYPQQNLVIVQTLMHMTSDNI